MKLWIGHYLGDPNEWFMVWARNKKEAIGIIDGEYGGPDVRSLMEIDRPGGMGLFAKIDDCDDPELYFLEPNLEDPPILEISKGASVEEWVEQCIIKPFGPPEHIAVPNIAESMGIRQAEVMATYIEDMCPKCNSRNYNPEKGCSTCGYKKGRTRH